MKVLPTPFTRAMLGWISEANMSLRRWASIDGLVDVRAMNIRMSGSPWRPMTPCCVTCGGQQRRGQIDLVLHLDLRDVRVGSGREGQCDDAFVRSSPRSS